MNKSTLNLNLKDLNIMTNFFQPKCLPQHINSYSFTDTQSKPHDISQPLHTCIFYIINAEETSRLGANLLDLLDKEKASHLFKNLENLHKECEEEGYEVFDEVARINAKKILEFLCKNFPKYDYDIYPTDDREINIEFYSFKGRILILCDSKGSVAYFRSLDGEIDNHRYQGITSFCFDQLYEAFESFKNPDPSDKTASIIDTFETLNNEYKRA